MVIQVLIFPGDFLRHIYIDHYSVTHPVMGIGAMLVVSCLLFLLSLFDVHQGKFLSSP